MKKLMTMIAAVAMSFGLFAADATSYAISFETADGCTQGEALNNAAWTVPEGATATVIEKTLDYGYDVKPGDTRRTDLFAGLLNDNSLKLETGKGTVVCTPDIGDNAVFFDQVVKFTGYEEDPEVTDGKIAVWMSAIDTEGTEGEEDYEPGRTNLYITCGRVSALGEITLEKIDLGPADIDATHRVTIKSLGKVAEGKTGDIAGFLVYIDGEQVKADIAKGIVSDAVIVSDFADLNAAGALFPALVEGAVATVAYQGIGELDDVAVDALGPVFARYADVSFAPLTGATIAKVVDAAGNEFLSPAGVIKVKEGELQVYLAAKPGWILKITDPKVVNTADAVGGVITVELQEGDVVEAVAKIGTEYFETLEEALAAVKDGDTVEILKQATSADGNYSFTPNTTIAVTEGGNWAVYIGSYVEEEETVPGKLTDKAGVMPEKQIVVTGVEDSVLELAGAIQGNGRVETRVIAPNVVLVGTLTIGAAEGNGALLKADEIAFGTSRKPQTIALIGKGKVMTKDGTLTEEKITVPEGEKLEVSGPDADGYYTYQIAGTFEVTVELDAVNVTVESIVVDGETVDPVDYKETFDVAESITVTYKPADGYKWVGASETGVRTLEEAGTITAPEVKAKTGFIITIGENNPVEIEDVADALAAVQVAEAAGTFPIVVKAIDAQTVAYEGQEIVLAKDDQITIPALRTWVFLNGITITPTKGVVLAAGASLKVKGAIAAGLISAPADYRVKETNNGDGTYTYTTEAIAYVAQIGANKYETFDAAWTAAQENDEITLLADCTFGTAASAQVKLDKNLKLTLNGHVLTVKNSKYDRIYVIDDKKLTVDGTVEGSQLNGTLYAGINLSKTEYRDGNIVINGGTYVASDHNKYGLAAIQSNGGCGNSSITATNATFFGNNQSLTVTEANRDQQSIAAVLAAGGTYAFTGCSFTGHTGIYAKAGELTLDDCTVMATGYKFAPVAKENGSDGTGDAVIFDSNSKYKGNLKLDVKGDTTITSANGYAFQETVTRGSASATLEIAIAGTATITGEVVLSDAFAAAVKAGTASITGYAATVNNVGYQTVEDALLAVKALEAEEEYPITVAALAAGGLTITDGDNTAKIAAGVTIAITKGAWAVNDTLNYAGSIDGAVTAVAIAKIADAPITLNEGASVAITGDDVPETSFFACGAGAGYEVKKNDNVFTVGLIKVTATFIADDKTVDTQVIDYGTAPTNVVVTKEGYTFTGWDPVIGEITSDTTYTAQFDANSYAINYTWVDNDGAAVTALDNTLPETFTFDGEAIKLEDTMVTLTEAYTAVAFAPDTVTTDKAEAFAVTVTLTKKAADEPKNPEEPFDPPAGKTAAEYAAELNGNPAALKAIVKAPDCVTGGDVDTYKACFKAVASGDKVMLVLDEEAAEETIVPKLNTAEASIVGGNFSGTVSVEVIPGLYYGIAATADVGEIKGADAVEWVQATSANKSSFTLPVPEVKVGDVKSDKAFFQIKCTDVTTK